MPFMYDDFHQLFRDIVSKYIKPETLDKCKNASILCDVNFIDATNQLKNKEVDIGFGANKILTDKMKTDEITKHEIDVFTVDCLEFLESLTSKFVEKFPLKYTVNWNAKSLNPEIMCMTPEKGAKLFKSLVHTKRGGWYLCRVQAISWDGCNEKLSTVSEVQQ